MENTTLTVTKADLESMLRQAIAKGEANARNVGRPGFLYASNADRREQKEKAKFMVEYLKATFSKNDARVAKLIDENADWFVSKAAFSEANNGDGLYTVPTFWSDQIFSNVDNFGYARRIGKVFPMSAAVVNLTGAGAVTVSWPGANTAPTPFDATSFFTQTVLTANTMAAASVIQKELDEDTVIALLDYLSLQYGKAVALEEDKQYFNGTGSPFTGVCGTVTTNITRLATTAFSAISWTDMVDAKNSTNPDIQQNGVYCVSQTVFGFLQKEVDDNHRPIYFNESPRPNDGNTGINQTNWIYNGSPLWVLPNAVMPSTAANKVAAVFGDFGNYGILGTRRDVTMETFDQAYGGVDLSGKRQIAIQFTERIAVGFPQETAFAVVKTAT